MMDWSGDFEKETKKKQQGFDNDSVVPIFIPKFMVHSNLKEIIETSEMLLCSTESNFRYPTP